MRIGDGGLLQIDLERARPFLIVALHLHFNPGSVGAVPRKASLPVNIGLVPDRIDRNMKFGGELVSLDAAEDMERLGEGELRKLPSTHTLFRSFYLLSRPYGGVSGPDSGEAIERGGRAAVIYSRRDLGGAWDRDSLGNYYHALEPGGDGP